MRRLFIVCLGFAGLVGSWGWADEGRIPIFQPTTITQPGHYIVTRNISAPGTVVRIATDDVVLDLNGHSLTSLSGCAGDVPYVIFIDGLAGARDVVIRNGHLVNGCNGIRAVSGAPRSRIRIEEVEIEGSGDYSLMIIGPETLDIIRCYLHDATAGGMFVNGSGSFGGRILSN